MNSENQSPRRITPLEYYESCVGSAPLGVELIQAPTSLRQISRFFIPDEVQERFGTRKKSLIAVSNPELLEEQCFILFSRALAEKGCTVPKLYESDMSRGLLLLEDLGSESLLDYLKKTSESDQVLSMMKCVLDGLLHLQLAGKDIAIESITRFPDGFCRESILWDAHYFRDEFLSRTAIGYDSTLLEGEFEDLATNLLSPARNFFMHRDCQARNVMIDGGRPFFIDYERGRRGPLIYDVTSLLFHSRSGFSSTERDVLFRYYQEIAIKAGIPSQDLTYELFQASGVVRLLQNLGHYGKSGLGAGKTLFQESIVKVLLLLRELLAEVAPLGELARIVGLLNEKKW